MDLRRALTQQPVETATGLVMLGLGVYVTTLGASATEARIGLLATGGILTAFGGVLLSWIASKAYGAHLARQEFYEHLDAMSRALGQAAGHISRVVDQAQHQELHPSTAFALVSQGVRMIYGQVNEIAVLRGEVFDPANLIETAAQLDALARQLENRTTADDEDAEDIEDLRRQIEEVRSTLTRPIGGSVLPDEPPPPRPRWAFRCPECSLEMATRKDGKQRTMVCTNCFEDLLVDTSSESVYPRGKYTHTVAVIAGRSGSRPIVACPIGGRTMTALLNSGRSYFAFCQDHRQLMEVPHDAFAAWRQGDGGAPSTPTQPSGLGS